MYTPPILYATQDDINERRKVRLEFRDNERNTLIQSIDTVHKRDKFEKSLKQGNKQKMAAKKDKKSKKNKKKQKKNLMLGGNNAAAAAGTSDQLDKDASYRDIQQVVDLAATAGPVQIVRLMRANPTHFKVLAICCGSLGDLAAFSRRDHVSQDKGMFKSRNLNQYHGATDHVCVAIGEADGIKAILDAMIKHRTKDALVLRGLWALAHILEVRENWIKYISSGGPQRLEVIQEYDYASTGSASAAKINAALKKLKTQPIQGNHIRSQLCVLL